MAANVFTFGGLKTTPAAEVVDRDGRAIRGLWAAGEMTGLYYSNYTGSTSVLRGATFGRIAGTSAARPSRDGGLTCGSGTRASRCSTTCRTTATRSPGTWRAQAATGHGGRPARHGAGHLPARLPGHAHRLRLPRRAAPRAVRPGRAAGPGRGVRRVPDRDHPRHRRSRRSARSSTSRSSTFGQTSVLVAAQLGDCVGIVNFIAALEPQLRRNLRNYRLDRLVGPIVQVEAGVHRRDGGVRRPGSRCSTRSRPPPGARSPAGANVIVPGEGPLNVFLADQGVARVDDVPVLDSLGTCVRVAELRAAQYRAHRSAPVPGRVLRRAAAAAAARRGARVLRRAGGPGMSPADDRRASTSRSSGGGAAGMMTALRASQDPDLVVAVFEKSTREGCNAAISSGSLAAGGTRFQRAAGIEDSPRAARRRHPRGQRRRGVATGRRGAVRGRAGGRRVDRGHRATRSRSAPTCRGPGCRSRACTPTSAGSAARRLMRHLRGLLDDAAERGVRRRGAGGRSAHVDDGRRPGWSSSQNGDREEVAARRDRARHRRVRGRPGADGRAPGRTSAGPFYGGVSTSTGDALAWLRRARRPVPQHGRRPALRPGRRRPRHAGLPRPAVQRRGAASTPTGQRFVDEEAHGYSSMAGILQQQPGETRRHGLGRHRDGGDPGVGDDARVPRRGRDRDPADAGRTRRPARHRRRRQPRRRSRPWPAAGRCGRRTTWPG